MPSLLQLPANQLQLVQLLLQQLTNLQQSNQLVATAHGMARFDWLVRSLQSGFPNEVDLAINSLIMLSNDSEKVFVISNKPHLLSVLLAHVGIFWEGTDFVLHNYYVLYIIRRSRFGISLFGMA